MLPLIMTFKERLKDQIKYQGLTYKELGAIADVSPRAIQNYLGIQSSIPPADVAVKLAQALGVTVEYLITGVRTSLTADSQVVSKGYGEYVKYRDIIDRLNKLPQENLAHVKPFLLSAIDVELKKIEK